VRVLLVALNASYVHTNLAVRYLREVLKQENREWEIHIGEFTINERLENIAAEIYEKKPDIIGFSCYVWNISQTVGLVRRLRQIMPRTFFLAGGPEVSFDSPDFLERNPEWDGVIAGEAEYSLPQLVRALSAGKEFGDIVGLTLRNRGEDKEPIITNSGIVSLPDLNLLPNPYVGGGDFRGRLVYVETSRGCPYQCEFCISSTVKRIRYMDPEKFREILRGLFDSGAATIKFVDRTFNSSKKHAFAILDVFRQEAQKCEGEFRAHCEIAGEMLDEEWLEYLNNYPLGMIQLEIGVQSTHQPTLDAVKRPQSFSKWQEKIHFIQHTSHIPVHLDLIAGLPLEGWQEFRKSFNEVFEIRPNHLQMGFLKVLKGSGIRKKSREYGLVYAPDPPYTILKTEQLSPEQIIALTVIEEILEKYYNSGKFKYSLEYILSEEKTPFDFFYALSLFWKKNGWFSKGWTPGGLFENLWSFLIENNKGKIKPIWREVLRFDFFMLERPGKVPSYLREDSLTVDEERKVNFTPEEIRKDPCWQEIIAEAGKLDRRQWTRATAVEYFTEDIPEGINNSSGKAGCWYLFYYGNKKTGFFRYPLNKEIN